MLGALERRGSTATFAFVTLPIYQVDAFAEVPFTGNPAAICPLEAPAEAGWMQAVAAEMNLAETAFLVERADGGFDLRWFTPAVEVPLCGHATLAAAHLLWESGRLPAEREVRFFTKSGELVCTPEGEGRIAMRFPALATDAEAAPPAVLEASGAKPVRSARVRQGGATREGWLLELADESAVRALAPDMAALGALGNLAVIATARAESAELDFVSRFFAPGAGVPEDPVTGSAHCALASWWADALGKRELAAFQASPRGGRVDLRLEGRDRVVLVGRAVTVLRGELLAEP